MAPARDLAMAALAISTVGSVLYAVAPNDMCVLASRFIVGMAAGVQGPFYSMAAGLCKDHERLDTLIAVRSVHVMYPSNCDPHRYSTNVYILIWQMRGQPFLNAFLGGGDEEEDATRGGRR